MKRIGFIGAGIMGLPMARNLLKAGFAVKVFNRTRRKAEPLVEFGAEIVSCIEDAARDADAVITVVSDSPDARAVYLDGVCRSIAKGALAIDMSTISPAVTCELAKAVEVRGATYIDAPVSGGKNGAETGTLSIMCGGAAEDIERARPIFAALGKNVVHCGPTGYGQMTKLCNQILCGMNLLGVCEAFVMAEKAGLDLRKVLQATTAGAAGSWALANLGEKMRVRDFAPMFMIDLQQKDLRIALSEAASARVSLPGTALVSQLLAVNQAAGEGAEGTQALLKTLERMAGMDNS